MKKTYVITFLCALSGLSMHTMHASDAPSATTLSQKLEDLAEALQRIYEDADLSQDEKFRTMLSLTTPELRAKIIGAPLIIFFSDSSATAPSKELEDLVENLQRIDEDAALNQDGKFDTMLSLITPELQAEIINVKGYLGAPLLAAFSSSIVITQLLIHIGCNVNAGDDFGTTPLMIACEHGNTAVATALLNAGAQVNAKKFDAVWAAIGLAAIGIDTAGNTALHQAVYYDAADTTLIELLLDQGADKTLTNTAGKTAYDLAFENGRSAEIITLLA